MPNSLMLKGVIGLILAVVATSLLAFTYYKGSQNGRKLERSEWLEKEVKRQQVEKEVVLARVETDRLLQKANDAKTRSISDEYQKKLAVLLKSSSSDRVAIDAAGGLRDPGKGDRHDGEAKAEVFGGCNGPAAGDGKLSERAQEFLWAEAERADKIVEQARACQSLALEFGLY